MALVSQEELELEKQAINYANNQPMSYHADSCPYLISNRRRNCSCSCKTFKLDELLRKKGLYQ